MLERVRERDVQSRHNRSCNHCSMGSPALYRIGSVIVISVRASVDECMCACDVCVRIRRNETI